jgi:hypothetical protein
MYWMPLTGVAAASTAWERRIMRTISTSIDIDATPGKVWAVLTDLPRYPEWNPFIQRAAGTVAAGARLTLRMVSATGKASTFKPTVLTADPGRELRWIGHLLVPGIFDGEHSFVLTAANGGTHLTQNEKFTGLLIPLTSKLLDGTADSFAALNEALKKRAEAG